MKTASFRDLYTIEPLAKGHDRKSFTCGEQALDRYLRQQATQDAKRDYASVFVAVAAATGVLHGFYSLSMASINLDLLPEELARTMPRYPTVPAVRLGRLAVHLDARGQGLGAHLLIDAMARSSRSEIAWTAFIVDAKDTRARAWYEQFGFLSLEDDRNHLFLPRKTIEQLGLARNG